MISQQSETDHMQCIEIDKPISPSIHIVTQQQQKIQAEDQNSYFSLHSANPILPPGIHKDNIKFQHKYLTQRSKLNKTTFPQVRRFSWMNTTPLDSCRENNVYEEQEQNNYVNHQYEQLLESKIPVYERINNQNYNTLGGDSASFCSLYFNTKKDSVKSRKTPIYQYLQKMCKDIIPRPIPHDILHFNSSFQSGNLLKVYRCPKSQMLTYQLYMQNDINTKGCTQWFYFAAIAQRRSKVKFRIMNFYKPTSLYMMGMKILISENKNQWRRLGTSISYYKQSMDNDTVTYVMEFLYQIEKPNLQYRFSYGYPYTCSQLDDYLIKLTDNPQNRRILNKSVLCQSFLGSNIYMLTISQGLPLKLPKPIIYIIARQHPGQTPASFVAEGMISFLLSNRPQMIELRQNFVFKIVPLCNIDGAINGNYRSNFSGNDINRQWWGPSRKLHPQVYYIKQQILNNKKNVAFFLDLHAHSRKMNSFFYGSKSNTMQNRMYPFVCSKLNKSISFNQCSFTDDPSKRTTARVIVETEIGIKKSLTFQVSFYGYQCPQKKTKKHFSREDFKGLGQSLALGLYYSEIGSQKYNDKKQTSRQKKDCDSTTGSKHITSLSCKLDGEKIRKNKKRQIEQKIERNCRKIFDKWKKQVERVKKDDDVFSEGSSLDPEHFQLQEQQTRQINTLSDHLQGKTIPVRKKQKQIDQEKQQQQQQEKRKTIHQVHHFGQSQKYDNSGVLIFKNKRLQRNKKDDKYSLEPISRLQKTNNQLDFSQLGFSQTKSTEFKVPLALQSNLQSSFMVKKLQSELQMQRTQQRYQMASTGKTSEQIYDPESLDNQIIKGHRFKSIEVLQKKQINKYRNNIFQMKKALRHLIDNKTNSYNYEDLKNNLWHATNGRSLTFVQNLSKYEKDKKYRKK